MSFVLSPSYNYRYYRRRFLGNYLRALKQKLFYLIIFPISTFQNSNFPDNIFWQKEKESGNCNISLYQSVVQWKFSRRRRRGGGGWGGGNQQFSRKGKLNPVPTRARPSTHVLAASKLRNTHQITRVFFLCNKICVLCR